MLILKGVLLGIGLFVAFCLACLFWILRMTSGRSFEVPVDMLRMFGTFVAACGAGLMASGILTIVLWKVALNSFSRHLPR